MDKVRFSLAKLDNDDVVFLVNGPAWEFSWDTTKESAIEIAEAILGLLDVG